MHRCVQDLSADSARMEERLQKRLLGLRLQPASASTAGDLSRGSGLAGTQGDGVGRGVDAGTAGMASAAGGAGSESGVAKKDGAGGATVQLVKLTLKVTLWLLASCACVTPMPLHRCAPVCTPFCACPCATSRQCTSCCCICTHPSARLTVCLCLYISAMCSRACAHPVAAAGPVAR